MKGSTVLCTAHGSESGSLFSSLTFSPLSSFLKGVGVAQLVSVQPSELEVPGSIIGDSNVCFDFLLICEALALSTRKTEH